MSDPTWIIEGPTLSFTTQSNSWIVSQVQFDGRKVSVFADKDGNYSQITIYDAKGKVVAIVDSQKHTITVVNGACK